MNRFLFILFPLFPSSSYVLFGSARVYMNIYLSTYYRIIVMMMLKRKPKKNSGERTEEGIIIFENFKKKVRQPQERQELLFILTS